MHVQRQIKHGKDREIDPVILDQSLSVVCAARELTAQFHYFWPVTHQICPAHCHNFPSIVVW